MNGRFAVLTARSYPQIDGIIMEFETDCPCRLTMRYTPLTPSKHLEPLLRRGLQMHCDPRFCFTRVSEIEQQEEGDTLIHNFWPKGLDAWKRFHCYLYGTIAGIDSPSTSPIMEFDNTFRKYKFVRHERGTVEAGTALSYNNPLAMAFECFGSFRKPGIRLWLQWYDHTKKFSIHLYNTAGDGRPSGSPIASKYYDHCPRKRLAPNSGYFTFLLEPFILGAGTIYSIVIYGDPDYPDYDVMWWSASSDLHALWDERAWRGTKQNGAYGWVKYPHRTLYYDLYKPPTTKG